MSENTLHTPRIRFDDSHRISRITSKSVPILLGILVAASMYPWGAQ